MNYFAESEILTDEYPLYKALLYFNLPFDSIIKDLVKPKLIFKHDIMNAGTPFMFCCVFSDRGGL